MIYEESSPKWFRSTLLIMAAFVLMYPLWQVGDRELYWSESSFAAMASEIDWEHLTMKAHGELIPLSFPLYPWMAATLQQFGISIELALRGISIGALAIITIMVGETGRRAANLQAGVVAAAMMLSSNIVMEKALDGYPTMLCAALLMTAWLTWFWFGAVGGHWNRAWMYSMFFCGLSFYAVGWQGIVAYFIPLIFMRRPLSFWPKLQRAGFYNGVAILVFFILLWGIPRWASGEVFRSLPLGRGEFEGYWEHLLNYPFDVVVRFLPWSFIAWAPFCVALQPLEQNPIFTRFLRTIVISLFVAQWISPYTEARDIVLLAPPLALLTGMNYWIVVRRYGCQIKTIQPYFALAALVMGAGIIVFYATPVSWWSGLVHLSRGCEFHDLSKYLLLGVVNGILIVLAALTLLLAPREKVPIWAAILVITAAVGMTFWSLPHPYRAQEASKRTLGKELRQAIESTSIQPDIVFKDNRIGFLYGECYYMGYAVRTIKKIGELPQDKKDVFLLSNEFPLDPSRIWTNLLPDRKKYQRDKIYLWHGVINPKKIINGKIPLEKLSLDE